MADDDSAVILQRNKFFTRAAQGYLPRSQRAASIAK